MKIIIENFQSIEHCDFEIPEGGFTCLVGPSNIGKSSLRRAMECLFYNKSEKSYIRKGTNSCSVQIILNDGTHIKWSRDKKSSFYEINGDTYSKLNKGVPQILLDKGFQELVLNKDRFSVQIAHQFKNIFLLDQSGSKITEVFSNLGNLNKIIGANKACLSDLRSNKSKLSLRKEDLFAEKEKTKNFRGLDIEVVKLENIKSDFLKLKKKQDVLTEIQKLGKGLENKEKVLSQYLNLKSLNLVSIDINYDIFTKLSKIYQKYQVLESNTRFFSFILGLKEVSLDLEKEKDKFMKVSFLFKKALSVKKIIYNLKKAPSKIDSIDISIESLKKFEILVEKLMKSKKILIGLREDIKRYDLKLTDIVKKETKIKKELKICPLCEKEF